MCKQNVLSPLLDWLIHVHTLKLMAGEKETRLQHLVQGKGLRVILYCPLPFFPHVISLSVLSTPSPTPVSTATALMQPSSVFWSINPHLIFSRFLPMYSPHPKRAFRKKCKLHHELFCLYSLNVLPTSQSRVCLGRGLKIQILGLPMETLILCICARPGDLYSHTP